MDVWTASSDWGALVGRAATTLPAGFNRWRSSIAATIIKIPMPNDLLMDFNIAYLSWEIPETRYDDIMADEIEYKFLLSEMPDLTAPDMDVQRISFIRQCYLAPPSGWAEQRIRWEHDATGQHVTQMSKRDLPGSFANVRAREESEEVELSPEEADRLIAEQGTGELTKTRYRVAFRGILLELDLFHGPHPLYLVEIEVPHPLDDPQQLVPSQWPVVRNVSEEDEYKSYSLAHRSV